MPSAFPPATPDRPAGVHVRLTVEERALLDLEAARRGTTRTRLAREAIGHFIAQTSGSRPD